MKKIIKKIIPNRLGHLGIAVLANIRYGFPARGLKVIGVTGTNGKTTTSTMIHAMLRDAGKNVGLMTTVAYGVNDDIIPVSVHMTTAPAPVLLRRIKEMRRQGIEWLVLETTSHALDQYRVLGVPYSIAVLTNVTHEHLDYHGTFENYRDAKAKLFTMTGRNKQGMRLGVINAEDPSAEIFQSKLPNALMYGLKKGDIQAKEIKSSASGSTFTATYGDRKISITTNLPGSFNVSNTLAAVGVGIAVGLTDEQISSGIKALSGVEGRMDTIEEGQDFGLIVDFAHTPDSFEKLLPEVRKVTKGRLITLFGSAGRRDEAKRAIQGLIAGEYSDIVVITEEDDRDVDGLQIMEQIASGAESNGKKRDKDLFLIHDRTEAIEYAVSLAQPGDTVLLLGKGHEKTIERADGEHPWDEIEVARNAVRKRK